MMMMKKMMMHKVSPPAGGSPVFKVLECGSSETGGPDFLIADASADALKCAFGQEAVYAQVADRLTAEIFVKAANEYPALRAFVERLAALPKGGEPYEEHAEYELGDAEACGTYHALIDEARSLVEHGSPRSRPG